MALGVQGGPAVAQLRQEALEQPAVRGDVAVACLFA